MLFYAARTFLPFLKKRGDKLNCFGAKVYKKGGVIRKKNRALKEPYKGMCPRRDLNPHDREVTGF
jgi:hypothetical protein